jgi:tetratricopeptide (TPR) repeat protein
VSVARALPERFRAPSTHSLSRTNSPCTAEQYVAVGDQLAERGSLADAEACYRKALALNESDADTPGHLSEIQGDKNSAVETQKALERTPTLRIARRRLATLLVRVGRSNESLYFWQQELLAGADGLSWARGVVSAAMRATDLTLAGAYAEILAQLRWGSRWYPPRSDGANLKLLEQTPVTLTVPKLFHDIDQFEYLQSRHVLGDEFTPIINAYKGLVGRLATQGTGIRVQLEGDDRQAIGHVYNRIVHLRPTPRVQCALGAWDRVAVENQYLHNPPGVVIVDDFLSGEALESLRLFCLESTVWLGNRYAHGRLGAFFHDGFNCPLLLQIAEELRQELPRVIGDKYPLEQLWAFKNATDLPADATTHADFAAVNVNFWVTPDRANLDYASGGLVVYDIDAPIHWDFATYNNRLDAIIRPFLLRQRARSITIPYRQNRAMIFNSDLFHGTDAVRFRSGYENLRVNVTMLYGHRENDVHHPPVMRQDPIGEGSASSWRSASFTRSRRRSAMRSRAIRRS